MNNVDLKNRTKLFALSIIKLTQGLKYSRENEVLGKQLLRSATSVAANYRSACRSRSQAEFISKINICEEEADESLFWLELFKASELLMVDKVESLMIEANELTSIFVASGKTAKQNMFNSTNSKIRTPHSEII